MSYKGKIRRGEKWLNLMENNLELKEAIEKDANKMADVNFYLAEKAKKVEEIKSKGKK